MVGRTLIIIGLAIAAVGLLWPYLTRTRPQPLAWEHLYSGRAWLVLFFEDLGLGSRVSHAASFSAAGRLTDVCPTL